MTLHAMMRLYLFCRKLITAEMFCYVNIANRDICAQFFFVV